MRTAAWSLLLLLSGLSIPARAEIGTSLSLASDDRFRGQSLSNGHPVATLDMTYDDVSGFYLAGSATAVLTSDGPHPLNIKGNIGHAWKLRSGPAIDIGIVASGYTDYYSGGENAHYTEFYAGVASGHLSARIAYSPDYFRSDVQTIYGEINAAFSPVRDWQIGAHAGALFQMAGQLPPDGRKVHRDWRVSLAKQAGDFEVQLALTGGGRNADYYEQRPDRTTVLASIAYMF
ncbi:TorF family putative porin [Sphingobium sp. EM0848]|uniref:TorF family putative porin n=1 Tax=Sphingobium sp. EM0848 TaxID=2743473 RepID=UPI00159C80A5|nr:TorF family putative porin [Sphingobium sp. EM0848]